MHWNTRKKINRADWCIYSDITLKKKDNYELVLSDSSSSVTAASTSISPRSSNEVVETVRVKVPTVTDSSNSSTVKSKELTDSERACCVLCRTLLRHLCSDSLTFSDTTDFLNFDPIYVSKTDFMESIDPFLYIDFCNLNESSTTVSFAL